jgi:phosphohistidine phosphatase
MTYAQAYLVRHAKAEKESDQGDAGRRLTPEGRAAFRQLAAALAGRLKIDRILTSPFVRARETAELLAEATGAPVEEAPELASGHLLGRELLAFLQQAGPGVAAVGHNPEIADAIAATGYGGDVKPGTVAALELAPAGPALAWLEAPTQA